MNRLTMSHLAGLTAAALLLGPAPLQAQATRHVARNGQTPSSPYLTWATAASNLQDAVRVAAPGDTVLVTNGVYSITNLGTAIATITNAITLRSVNGPEVTILDVMGTGSTDRRGLRLMTNAAGAVVEGLTIRGVDYSLHSFDGGGIYMNAGLVTNCHLIGNRTGGRGGGVFVAGGMVTDCLIVSNRSTEWNYALGGGVCLVAGLVRNCVLEGNSAEGHMGGGGAGLYGGVMENCRIVRNRSLRWHDWALGTGGGVKMTGGQLLHCTIADNFSRGVGGGLYMTAGSVTNCIIYHNTNNTENLAETHNVYRSAGTLAYSCAFPAQAGPGNTAEDPCFADRAAGDYRLLPGSPCLDTGTNLSAVTLDLEGSPRPTDGSGGGLALADMGCYEAGTWNAGALRAGFTAGMTEHIESLEVAFTAHVAGADTTISYYGWDFNKDGAPAMAAAGPALSTAATNFTPGWYDIQLTVSNASGETASSVRRTFVKVAPPVVHVATNGGHVFPFASEANASTSLLEAVETAYADSATASVVRVAAGIYLLPEPLGVQKGIVLESVAGPEATLLTAGGGTYRCLNVTHSNALVHGFTLKGANYSYHYYYGGCARVAYGTVSNCVITGSRVGGAGGGLCLINEGLVTDSIISSNWCSEWQYGYGGGLYMNGGTLERCRILGNYTLSHQGGGGAYVAGGVVRNCFFFDNSGRSTTGGAESDGGGALLTGTGQILSSTFVNNWAVKDGGGILMVGGGLTNTIVYGNWVTTVGSQNLHGSGGTIRYTCSPDLPHDPGGTGNLSSDPRFEEPAAANYRLLPTSPCHRTGTTQPWMTGAADLEGKPRLVGGRTDMGCFQTGETRGTVLTVF